MDAWFRLNGGVTNLQAANARQPPTMNTTTALMTEYRDRSLGSSLPNSSHPQLTRSATAQDKESHPIHFLSGHRYWDARANSAKITPAIPNRSPNDIHTSANPLKHRSEERRVGKEC